MIRLLNKNSDLKYSQKSSRTLVQKAVLIHAMHVLYIKTLLRALQAGIKNTNPLIKDLPSLFRKCLGSFTWISTILHVHGNKVGIPFLSHL